MFFFGKTLWLFLQPLSLAFILIILASLLRWTGRRVLPFLFTTLSILMLFAALFTSVGAWALSSCPTPCCSLPPVTPALT